MLTCKQDTQTERFLAQAKQAPVNEARLAAYRRTFADETRRVLAPTVPIPKRFRTAVSKSEQI
jgi:hypothetical protein